VCRYQVGLVNIDPGNKNGVFKEDLKVFHVSEPARSPAALNITISGEDLWRANHLAGEPTFTAVLGGESRNGLDPLLLGAETDTLLQNERLRARGSGTSKNKKEKHTHTKKRRLACSMKGALVVLGMAL